jgi:hypothetical protein
MKFACLDVKFRDRELWRNTFLAAIHEKLANFSWQLKKAGASLLPAFQNLAFQRYIFN